MNPTTPTRIHSALHKSTFNQSLSGEELKQANLVSRIVSSGVFKTTDAKELFLFLVDNRWQIISGHYIATQHLNLPDEPGLRTDEVRALILAIREALNEFRKKSPTEEWVCDLPKLKTRGYKIDFKLAAAQNAASAAKAFWGPHALFGDDVIVACGSHLFFHDPDTKSAIRFYDFNETKGEKETLDAFKAAHAKAYKDNLKPWHHSYLSNGEVNAYEALLRWFHADSNLLPRRYQSREITLAQIFRLSPILLGRPETNLHIKAMMETAPAKHLGYRIHEKLGAIRIDKINSRERKKLGRFPMSNDGVLGPLPSTEMVFGLVSRFPQANGRGPVTIISADSHARAVSKIAEELTLDASAKIILEKTGWAWQKGLPESFEMLFSVTISSPDLEGEGKAELLVSRP